MTTLSMHQNYVEEIREICGSAVDRVLELGHEAIDVYVDVLDIRKGALTETALTRYVQLDGLSWEVLASYAKACRILAERQP